jgi:hypothetical protein
MDAAEDLESRIDDILAASFPASDPPPWTMGVEWRKATAGRPEAEAAAGEVAAREGPAVESY